MHGKKIVQILKVIDLIARPNGATTKEILEILEKTDRKVPQRVIMTIEGIGFPVNEEDDETSRYKRFVLDREFAKRFQKSGVPDFSFKLSEIVALYFMRAQAKTIAGSSIEDDLEPVFKRLDAFVPEGMDEKVQDLNRLFVTTDKLSKDYAGKERIIEDLIDAVLEKQTCFVEYDSFESGKVVKFRIDPLHIFEHSGGLYLFVRSTKYDSILVLALERIITLTTTGDTFDYPNGFDPKGRLDKSFDLIFDGDFETSIWVSASQARYVRERKYFQNQNIKDNPDGSIILHLKTSGRYSVMRWVLSQGSEVEVIAPEDFREEVKRELEVARGFYD